MTGAFVLRDGHWYMPGPDGSDMTGWHMAVGEDGTEGWYYLWPYGWEGHPKGSMARDCTVFDLGRFYRFTESGELAKGQKPPIRRKEERCQIHRS